MKKKLLTERLGDIYISYRKILLIMRFTLFLSFLAIFQAFGSGSYSQEAKLSLDFKNVTVVDILNEIEEKTEFSFLYNNQLIDTDRLVSFQCTAESIENVLDGIFNGTDVGYVIKNRLIILTNQIDLKINVSGKVTGTSGEPIPGATVILKETTQGTVTDAEGNYSLSNVPSDATMVFSFVGMKTQEVPISGRTNINVILAEETIGIEEVVAIGYGTIRKGDLTGSVATVSTKDFDKVPATTPLQVLQGRATGLQITSGQGYPGSGGDILIRGRNSIGNANSPIFVVDGVVTSGIDNLNPNSIESVSILKDASAAAIYGARASNGVILVTTKRGEGKKDLDISINAYTGIQTEGNLKLKLLNADQWLDLWTEAYDNAGIDLGWTQSDLAQFSGIDTDWKDLMMQTGLIQNYDLSVSGGSEKSNYFISANFLDQKGMVIETDYEKYTLTFNTDHKINKWIKFGNSLNLYATQRKVPTSPSPWHIALAKVPLTRHLEDDGDYGYIRNPTLEHIHANPVWLAKNNSEEGLGKGLLGSLYLTLQLMKGLDFTARGSVDYRSNHSTTFVAGVPIQYGWEGQSVNSVDKNWNETVHWTSDFLLNYDKTFAEDHNIKILLGYSAEESSRETLEGYRTSTPNNSIRYLDAGDPATMTNSNGFSDWAFASMFGRLNYNFRNKYLLTATVRRDATSRLTADTRVGVFPSGSVAWRISEEGFLQNADFIDDLKIRAGYGALGNIESIGVYIYPSLNDLRQVLGGAAALGYTLTGAVNTDLKWESSQKKNIAIDATLFDNKVYSTIEYYINDTHDLLFSESLPYSDGLTGSPTINAGQVRNSGYEVEAGYRNQKGDWSYDVSVNLSHNKNEVIDLGGRDLRTSGIVEGYPVSSYFGYKSDGLIRDASQLSIYQEGDFTNKQVGDIHLLDIDGYDAENNLTGIPDGKVDDADRTIIGRRYPDLIYGALGTVSYKNWSLQVQLQGVQGIDLNYGPNNYLDAVVLMTSFARNEDARVIDRYHPTKNPNGTWPRLSLDNSGQNTTFSEFWLADASYLRVKNVNLNYNLSNNFCGKLGMKQLSVYASVENAWVFTKYDGPEVDTNADPLTGIPQPRTWTLGLKATF